MTNHQLKIALIGYGKMGRTIEQLALQKNHSIKLIIDNQLQWDSHGKDLADCDVAIEFTSPEAAPANIRRCFEAGIPVVTGTTGWLHELPTIEKLCLKMDQSLFYASNFSIGVNIFFALNNYLAVLLKNLDGYKPRIIETHHTAKLDAPSGTAISLAADIIKHRQNLKMWGDADQDHAEEVLPIKSYRIENITGTHVVTYDSAIDTIEVKHEAHNRSGFAEGAIIAAQWLIDKKGIYTMKDLMKLA